MSGFRTASQRDGNRLRGFQSAEGAGIEANPGFLYVRIYMTANNGDSYYQIYEVEVAASAGGADQCTGGTGTASENHVSYPPARAFDGGLTDGTSWASDAGAPPIWLKYAFPSEALVYEVSIWGPATAQAARAPKDFLIEGSNDNIAWTTLKTVTNQTAWGNIEKRTFVI